MEIFYNMKTVERSRNFKKFQEVVKLAFAKLKKQSKRLRSAFVDTRKVGIPQDTFLHSEIVKALDK